METTTTNAARPAPGYGPPVPVRNLLGGESPSLRENPLLQRAVFDETGATIGHQFVSGADTSGVGSFREGAQTAAKHADDAAGTLWSRAGSYVGNAEAIRGTLDAKAYLIRALEFPAPAAHARSAGEALAQIGIAGNNLEIAFSTGNGKAQAALREAVRLLKPFA